MLWVASNLHLCSFTWLSQPESIYSPAPSFAVEKHTTTFTCMPHHTHQVIVSLSFSPFLHPIASAIHHTLSWLRYIPVPPFFPFCLSQAESFFLKCIFDIDIHIMCVFMESRMEVSVLEKKRTEGFFSYIDTLLYFLLQRTVTAAETWTTMLLLIK